jgi:hypothetical protein
MSVDPFDDQPLRYRVDDDRVVIYSTAEDLTDDGGYVDHRCEERPFRDCGFVLLKPEFRGRPAPPPEKTTTTQPASAPEM